MIQQLYEIFQIWGRGRDEGEKKRREEKKVGYSGLG